MEAFASFNGPHLYNLPSNSDTITQEKVSWDVPATMSFGESKVVPIKAGEQLSWKEL